MRRPIEGARVDRSRADGHQRVQLVQGRSDATQQSLHLDQGAAGPDSHLGRKAIWLEGPDADVVVDELGDGRVAPQVAQVVRAGRRASGVERSMPVQDLAEGRHRPVGRGAPDGLDQRPDVGGDPCPVRGVIGIPRGSGQRSTSGTVEGGQHAERIEHGGMMPIDVGVDLLGLERLRECLSLRELVEAAVDELGALALGQPVEPACSRSEVIGQASATEDQLMGDRFLDQVGLAHLLERRDLAHELPQPPVLEPKWECSSGGIDHALKRAPCSV